MSCAFLEKGLLPWFPWCFLPCILPWIPCGKNPEVELVPYKQKHIYQYFMHEVDGSNARDNNDLDLNDDAHRHGSIFVPIGQEGNQQYGIGHFLNPLEEWTIHWLLKINYHYIRWVHSSYKGENKEKRKLGKGKNKEKGKNAKQKGEVGLRKIDQGSTKEGEGSIPSPKNNIWPRMVSYNIKGSRKQVACNVKIFHWF